MKEVKKASLHPTDGEQLNEGTFRSNHTKKGDIMKNIRKASVQFFLALALLAAPLVAFQLQGTEAMAQGGTNGYFFTRGCADCHGAPTAATCAGCHEHSGTLTATKNKTTSYTPGETVTITLTSSGARSGWIGVRLYNQSGVEIARSTGNQSGMGGSAVYPAVLSAPAPATAGTYNWRIAYFGNENGDGGGDVHSEKSVTVPISVASVAPPADTVAPVVTFTLPATATSLTVASSFSATDNVSVTGYLINKIATPPAASAAGWTTTAPASVTAVAGSNTFYAWAKDAANNVSAVKSATVVVTLPDTVAPVVTFSLPATATNLTILVSSFSATDNVAVTGYMVNKIATPPAASAAGWSTTAPASVTAVVGSNTYYAWAKDAANNVSAVKSATVVVTITVPDTVAPVVSFSLPATSTSLTVPASFSATDNVNVTGYMVNKIATPPAASAAGWTATAPASVTAVAGSNTFYAWAKDAANNVSAVKSASVTVTTAPAADTTKPTLTISSLANGSYTNKVTLNVSGTASDAGGIKSVTVNGQAVTVNPDASFSYALALTAGANTITTIATDNAGNQQVDTRTVTYDLSVPVLAVTAPADNSTTVQSFVNVTGTISETSTVTVSVNNGSPQSAAISGSGFSATANLVSGVNTIDITATDLAGNTTSAKRTVTYENSTSTFTLAVTNPAQDITTRSSSLTLKGKVVDASSRVKVRITMNGKTYSPKVDDGVFKQRLTFTKAKLYAITVTATDNAGNSSTVTRNVIYRPASRDKDDDDDDDDHDDD
jgi:hypothetical protein